MVSKSADQVAALSCGADLLPPGIKLDRSTLADLTGRAASCSDLVTSISRRPSPPMLFADGTKAPVLVSLRRGATEAGQLGAYAGDERPGGRDQSTANGLCPRPHSQSRAFDGASRQPACKALAGYSSVAEKGHVQLAVCWASLLRFHELAAACADRQRSCRAYQGALGHRGRDAWFRGRRHKGAAPGQITAGENRAGALASRKAQHH